MRLVIPMEKYQPSFDIDWANNAPPRTLRPPDSSLFIAYLKTVAPQFLTSKHPIHKTGHGYATNTSQSTELGQFEFDLHNNIIIHHHTKPVLVGRCYEYPVVHDVFKVEFLDGMMKVVPQ